MLKRFKRNDAMKKSKRPAGSIILYVAAIVVTIIGVVYLVTNIEQFQKTVTQYVAQGYPSADVASQLMPGIYEPIAVYGGIAFLLFGAGMINQKISKCLKMLDELEVEGAESDADKINEVAPDTSWLEHDVETGEVEAAEIETNEHDSGSLNPDPN
jgi:hypothetical protein